MSSLDDIIRDAHRKVVAEAASAKFDETNKDTTSRSLAALKGFQQGGSFGLADEAAGTIQAIGTKLLPQADGVDPSFEPSFAEAYRDTRDADRETSRIAEQEHQGAYLGGNLVGQGASMLAGGAALKGAGIARLAPLAGAGRLAKAGNAAAQGAAGGYALGGLQGFGSSNADGADLALDTLVGAGQGALLGGVGGGLAGARAPRAAPSPQAVSTPPADGALRRALHSPAAEQVAKFVGRAAGQAAVQIPVLSTAAGEYGAGLTGKALGKARELYPLRASPPPPSSAWAKGPQGYAMAPEPVPAPRPTPMSSPETPGGARPVPQPSEVPPPVGRDGRELPAGKGPPQYERLARERGAPREEPSAMESLDFGDETPAWQSYTKPKPAPVELPPTNPLDPKYPGPLDDLYTFDARRRALRGDVEAGMRREGKLGPGEEMSRQAPEMDALYRDAMAQERAASARMGQRPAVPARKVKGRVMMEDEMARGPAAMPAVPGADALLAQALETVPPAQHAQFTAMAKALPPQMLEQFLRAQLDARARALGAAQTQMRQP